MVIVTRGVNWDDGNPCKFFLDGQLARELKKVRIRVIKGNWDYVGLVCGLPGSGKSTFARVLARYMCAWSSLTYICFSAEEFIKTTNTCPEFSSVILDESFASLNSRITMTPDFMRIINHLQLIRQRHLFIFLCLPNFFDLAKGISIFRTSHLFITYENKQGRRGQFMAFGRRKKRILYVKGNKYMDYDCVRSNFKGRYPQGKKILSEEAYDKKKKEHLLSQEEKLVKKKKGKIDYYEIAMKMKEQGIKTKIIAQTFGFTDRTLQRWLQKCRDNPELRGIKPKTL